MANDILATTLEKLVPEYVDNTMERLPLMASLKEHDGYQLIDGGSQYVIPVVLHEHAGIVAHQTGWEDSATVIQDIGERATYPWSWLSTVVGINTFEQAENMGPEQKVSILGMRTKAQIGTFMRAIEGHLFHYNATYGAGSRPLYSLDGVTVASTTGFMEEVAQAAQTNNVGGLSKATYNDYWYNNMKDSAGGFTGNSEKYIGELHTAAFPYREALDAPKLFLSPISFNLYMADLETKARFMRRDELDSGRIVLVNSFGNRVEISPNLPFTVGQVVVSGYMLDIPAIRLAVLRAADFKMMESNQAGNSVAFRRNIVWAGQLCAGQLRSSGILLNSET